MLHPPYFHSLQSYFESIPGTPPCGFNESPADYLIECIGGGLRQRTDRDYSFDYRHSALAVTNAQELRVLRRSKGQAGSRLTESGYAAPLGTIYREVRTVGVLGLGLFGENCPDASNWSEHKVALTQSFLSVVEESEKARKVRDGEGRFGGMLSGWAQPMGR